MDQRTVLRTGQQRRNSPRLKGIEQQNNLENKPDPEANVPLQESKTELNSTTKAINTPDVNCNAASSPRTPRTPVRKDAGSRNSTPSSTSMQRELRKIEDYWTRQDPIKHDSPRLRYPKRRDTPNKNVTTSNTSNHKDDNVGVEPSTPTANVNDADTVSEISAPNSSDHNNQLFKQKDNQTSTPKPKSTDSEFLSESPFPKCDEDTTNIADSKTTGSDGKKSETVNESNVITNKKRAISSSIEKASDSEDEYLPPRKKLRSEVKQDELWDGIPLGVSFKRLTPLMKRNEDSQNDGTVNNSDKHIDDAGETSYEQFGKETDKHTNKPIATEIKDDRETVTNSVQQELKTSEETQNGAKDSDRNLFDDISKYSNLTLAATPTGSPQIRRRTRSQVRIETIQKSVEDVYTLHTQGKTGIVAEATDTDLCFANQDNSITEKGKSGQEPSKEENTASISTPKESSNATHNENNTEVTYVSVSKTDQSGNVEDMANMSISQILNCDSQTSISDNMYDLPEIANTVEIALETSVTSTKEGDISRERILTVTDIESDIVSDSEDNPKSNRRKTVEEKQEQDATEIEGEISNTESESKDVDAYISENETHTRDARDESVLKKKSSSSLFTFTKENRSDSQRKVPTLKIKLKHSKQNKRKADKTKHESKSSKSVENKKKTDDEKPSTSKEADKATEINDKTASKNESEPDKGEKKNDKPPSKKTKKKKLNRRESRGFSPPPNVNLRLNSERRLSMVNGLFSNKVLNNHACLLWSSENRRHMQLSHPNASSFEIDNLLREKWTELCEKEKLKYLQRAWHASTDENKHSNRRNDTYDVIEKKQQQPGNPSIERFLNMTSKKQHEEIKQWLQFYHEVSPEIYSCVINKFRGSLQAEKEEQENDRKNSKQKSKTKKIKNKKSRQLFNETDADAKHRRLMFEAILGNQKEILETWAEKKETQAQILRENFNNLVKKLVIGDDVELTKNVKSTRLTEALQDLKELEKNKMLTVSGERNSDNAYAALLNEVDDYLKDKNGFSSLLDSLDNACIDDQMIEEYLTVTNKMDEHKMPILNAVAIKNVLDGVSHKTKRQRNLSIFKKQPTPSPASLLTEWVAEDVIRANPNIEFRTGVSLLTNKPCKIPDLLSSVKPVRTRVLSTPNNNKKMQSLLGKKRNQNKNQNCNKIVTYTFAREQDSESIISKLKRLQCDIAF